MGYHSLKNMRINKTKLEIRQTKFAKECSSGCWINIANERKKKRGKGRKQRPKK